MTETQLIPYTPTMLDADVQRYLMLDAKAKDIADELASLKSRIRTGLGVGAHQTSFGVKVAVTPNRRFNEATATKVLGTISAELLAACTVAKVDSATTKRLVGDDVYAACTAEVGPPAVRIS